MDRLSLLVLDNCMFPRALGSNTGCSMRWWALCNLSPAWCIRFLECSKDSYMYHLEYNRMASSKKANSNLVLRKDYNSLDWYKCFLAEECSIQACYKACSSMVLGKLPASSMKVLGS